MNKNRKIKRGLTTSLAVGMSVMMGAVPVFAAGTSSDADAVYKEETVYVNADATGTKYKDIAIAMGVEGVEDMTQEEYRKAAVDAVAQLSKDVKIPQDLKDIVKEEDLDFLVDSAYNDACAPGNPKDATKEDIKALYQSLM